MHTLSSRSTPNLLPACSALDNPSLCARARQQEAKGLAGLKIPHSNRHSQIQYGKKQNAGRSPSRKRAASRGWNSSGMAMPAGVGGCSVGGCSVGGCSVGGACQGAQGVVIFEQGIIMGQQRAGAAGRAGGGAEGQQAPEPTLQGRPSKHSKATATPARTTNHHALITSGQRSAATWAALQCPHPRAPAPRRQSPTSCAHPQSRPRRRRRLHMRAK